MPAPWSWKPKDSSATGLRYEPGNWGDILKALWVVILLHWMRSRFGAEGVTVTDPFSGLPAYPLSPATARRQASLLHPLFRSAVAPHVETGRWPSAGALAAQMLTMRAGAVRVWDADPGRRSALREAPAFTLLDAEDGWGAVEAEAEDEQGLLLIDPYDFLAEWPERLSAVLDAAERTTVLLYIYNRSARGSEHLRRYRDFRNRLSGRRAADALMLGRVPADGFLPSAHHEMLLLPGPLGATDADRPRLRDELRQATEGLARLIAGSALFEG